VLYFETQPSGNSKTKQTYTPNNLKPLVSTKAWSLFVDGSENVWISSHSGLVVIEPDGSPLSVTGGNEKSSQLLFTEFSDFDKEGILAQSPTGIYILRKKKFQVFGEASGLPSPIITGFEQLDDKRVVVASLGGLSVFNASNDGQIIRSLSLKEDRLAHTEVMALESGTNGELWFGGFSGGLRVLENSLSRSRKISKSEKLDAVSVIRRFDDSRILVGTPYHGLYMVDDNGAEQIHISENSYPHTLAHNAVYSVLKIGGQLILVGGEGGIAEVTLQESSAVTKIAQVRHHLDRETILTIHESADGQLWAGSAQGGLYRASKPTGHTPISFEIAPTSPALPDNTIYAIEEDSSGYLWLSTNKGLVRLNSSTLSITTYNRTEGLPHDEFNLAASFSDQDQHLYFGGNQGFVRFDPRTFVEHRIHSSLYVTEIMIHREPVSYDPVYVETPEIVLDHNDHSLDVEFSTMDIISPGRSRYKYKLENFDNDWVDIGTRNSATFTSLPAGNYVLRVIGADSKGVWNYDGITLPVRVLPAPWLTWWAFASYALLFLGFLVLVKRSYDTYLQKVAATQEAEQMKITATLVMDDLQDQLEVENRLVDNLRKHTTSTFEMVDEFLTMELEELYGEEIDVPLGRVRERLNCLKALEAAVYFLGDQLKVNFRDAVDRCFAEVLKAHPHPTAELVLANDCCEELVAIDIAAPLLLMTHELILNSVTHAYPDSVGVECIEIKFKPEGGNYRFEYEDAGCGLPNSIDPARPTTVGMDLIARIITRLGATLEVERERGATFRAKIPGQEA
jgi:two-component sensor histidine kinase